MHKNNNNELARATNKQTRKSKRTIGYGISINSTVKLTKETRRRTTPTTTPTTTAATTTTTTTTTTTAAAAATTTAAAAATTTTTTTTVQMGIASDFHLVWTCLQTKITRYVSLLT
jgi:hypothetical protein